MRLNSSNTKNRKIRSAGCSCSYITDEWHGYGCDVSGGECMFIIPNSKVCAEIYGEGPDAYPDEEH